MYENIVPPVVSLGERGGNLRTDSLSQFQLYMRDGARPLT